MADLPDYYTQTAISEAEAASFKGGLDANKSAAPVSRDIYYATDSKILRVCVVDGTWININALYLLLAGGTMTGAIAMGANKITGLADPAAAQDAATRAYVLAQAALRLALTGGTMSGNIAMGTNKLTGLGAPTAQNNSLRYGQAEIRNAEIAAGAAILVSKLVNTYFPETLMTAQGDILVRGAANPERLAKITTGEFLKATATGYEGATPPAPTKEFFVPKGVYFTGVAKSIGFFEVIELNAAGEFTYFQTFKCPHDFTALTHCKVIGIKALTSTIDWTVETEFAAIGEVYTTHSDSDTGDGLAMTDLEIEEVDISAAFANLLADDYIGVKFTLDAIVSGDYHVLGLLFRYS